MKSRLKIFNSLARKKEDFRGTTNKKVGMYVCGITPYDVTHLGHAFTYVVFDVVARYLRFLGYQVTYVQNLTDIDDDILKKARQLKTNWQAVVKKNTRTFLKDMSWLNNLQPDAYPRATDHIKDIIVLVKKIIKRGLAYHKNGNVYFAVGKDKEYGKLSRLSKKKMLPLSAERGNFPDDPNKKNPLDFVLWQAQKLGEPGWFSPWGMGRPGWHIECSAMSQKYLGKTIDIHGGGKDLIFPHHESSIAQSECFKCKLFVRYWMHIGMLYYQGKKMSKSLGNMVFIADLKKRYNSNTIRLFLLSHYYRFSWEYFEKDIKKSERLTRLFKKIWSLPSGVKEDFQTAKYQERFFSAMNDDFDTKKAIAVLEKLAQDLLALKKVKNLALAKAFLTKAFNILGLQMDYE